MDEKTPNEIVRLSAFIDPIGLSNSESHNRKWLFVVIIVCNVKSWGCESLLHYKFAKRGKKVQFQLLLALLREWWCLISTLQTITPICRIDYVLTNLFLADGKVFLLVQFWMSAGESLQSKGPVSNICICINITRITDTVFIHCSTVRVEFFSLTVYTTVFLIMSGNNEWKIQHLAQWPEWQNFFVIPQSPLTDGLLCNKNELVKSSLSVTDYEQRIKLRKPGVLFVRLHLLAWG